MCLAIGCEAFQIWPLVALKLQVRTSASPGTDFRAYFIEALLICRIIILLKLMPPPRYLGVFLGPSLSLQGTPTSAKPGTDLFGHPGSWVKLWGHPHSETDCRTSFIKEILLWMEVSYLKLFPDPSRHLNGVLGPSPFRTLKSAKQGTDFRAYHVAS